VNSTRLPGQFDPTGRSEQRAHGLERCLHSPSSPPRQALRRPKNCRHSFELWPTDYKPRFTTTHTPPIPQTHHPSTTRPTTTTSSMNMLQIITRTQVVKPFPFNPHPSLIPQHLNTAVSHPSLLPTKANPLFLTNPSGIIPHPHPDLLSRRLRHDHFGRRSYSLPECTHNGPNQSSIPDPPGLTVLSALRTDRGYSDRHRPGD
jgi:hypothetical protein